MPNLRGYRRGIAPSATRKDYGAVIASQAHGGIVANQGHIS